jgi:Protein of unknown function (DUF1761)
MLSSFHELNYLAILIATILGFAFGAVWYSLLFGRVWRTEMKLPDMTGQRPNMAPYFIKGLIYTFISTVALAWLIALAGTVGSRHGAALGAGLGLLVVGARFSNSALWENKSAKLMAINIGHEVLLFALQGAILARWL